MNIITQNTKTFFVSTRLISCMLLVTLLCGVAVAADWPTYRSDANRSGYTSETVGPDLKLQWTFTPAHAPTPAWPMPSEERPRMHVDNAYHVAVVDGSVYSASSVSGKVYALDTASGEVRWTFFADGPVRFTPTVANRRVYFGSDDGYAYCLSARDGSLIWKYRAGPSDERVIGNGHMISLWPIRTSVLIDRGEALFAAGVFPYESIYVCALDASDGSVIWLNDTIGDRSHEQDFGGITPYGYILASKDAVYVPSGRAAPAAFSRKDGAFMFYARTPGKHGGVWSILEGDKLISGEDYSGEPYKTVYDAESGAIRKDVLGWFPGIDMVVRPGLFYVLTEDGIHKIDRASEAADAEKMQELTKTLGTLGKALPKLVQRRSSTKGDAEIAKLDAEISEMRSEIAASNRQKRQLKEEKVLWEHPIKDLNAMILAGNVIYAGGDGKVVGLNSRTGKEVWRAEVDGRAVGLAAAGGRLVVSTDAGPIYSFSEKAKKALNRTERGKKQSEPRVTRDIRKLARALIKDSGADKGWCLVLDNEDPALLASLANESEMKIVGIIQDANQRDRVREKLDAAGLLGSRITVQSWQLDDLPPTFANMIVSEKTLLSRSTGKMSEAIDRVLRPYGGAAYWNTSKSRDLASARFVKGAPEGAGNWTQQYANPQNTACSDDELVAGPLGLLWFGEPGPLGVVDRHAEAAAPVSINGRMFVQGEHLITAVDVYNGTLLWRREIPGAFRVRVKTDSGNMVATDDALYIAAHDVCYRLDPATGETTQTYNLPGSDDGRSRRWGYISVVDNILYGTAAKVFPESYGAVLDALIKNGKWKEESEIPKDLLRDYSTYKANYPVPDEDFLRSLQRRGTLWREASVRARGGEFTQKGAVTSGISQSDRIFAIDIKTGKPLWVHEGTQIANTTITMGEGKIFLTDLGVSDEQIDSALKTQNDLIAEEKYTVRAEVEKELEQWKGKRSTSRDVSYMIDSLEAELLKATNEQGSLSKKDLDIRRVAALDAVTGETCWEGVMDLTGCGGDSMGGAYHDGRLLFFGQYGNHDAWRHKLGGMKWRRITVLSGATGAMEWSKALDYRTRPLIVGDTIIIEPRACDISTGEAIMRKHPITGEDVEWEFLRPGHTCGITSASATGLFYRSSSAAYYDLEGDRGVTLFGGYRPGCAISMIPAGGVLLSPEASAGCTCSYPIRCSFALVRKPKRTQPWSVFVTPHSDGPAKDFAINLGAPADMRDEDGTMWFGYPNPMTVYNKSHYQGYGVKFDLNEQIAAGKGFFTRDHKEKQIDGTDKPWLFTTGCEGLLECSIPLVPKNTDAETASYTLKLGFMAPSDANTRKQLVDIKVQGQTVLKDFDISKATDAQTAHIKEFSGIQASDSLKIELVPHRSSATPTVNFIRAIREDG